MDLLPAVVFMVVPTISLIESLVARCGLRKIKFLVLKADLSEKQLNGKCI